MTSLPSNYGPEECIAEMLCPTLDTKKSNDELTEHLSKFLVGCYFVSACDGDKLKSSIQALQANREVPLAICADVEKSARCFSESAADFPSPMAMGAAHSPELICEMARSCALESRSLGVNWTLAPVVDLNLNFLNAVTNTRALGDKPERTCELLRPWIRTLQEYGLAATAKHFPGDGIDDRDQYLCTSVNSLPMEDWETTYGRIWRQVIDDGVMSIMPGHISLPAWQGFDEDVAECLPATLDKRLLTDLLRNRLGFQGVIISDAAVMVGLSSRAPEDEQIVKFVEAGGDVYLFADSLKDRERLLRAFRSGRISEERLRESASRVLAMKRKLGLFENPFGRSPSADEKAAANSAAMSAARQSLTLLKNKAHFPLNPQKVKRVLTVTLRYANESRKPDDLTRFDEALRSRGIQVDHLINPSHYDIKTKAPAYDVVFMNYYVTQHMKIGTMRLIEHFPFTYWRSFAAGHTCVCHTTFGTPYIEYDLPFIDNLLCAYGPEEPMQEVAVEAWFGEFKPTATCPVTLPKVAIQPFRACW